MSKNFKIMELNIYYLGLILFICSFPSFCLERITLDEEEMATFMLESQKISSIPVNEDYDHHTAIRQKWQGETGNIYVIYTQFKTIYQAIESIS